ncbi:MAG: hypothetical protein OQK50_04195 [Deltaproteobacteria bacterium]|jgi:hypothetical protein|nr:hypothetical protein [Deltaproteobacteria bacterium]MCW8892328.1 hypothetical protein [Deltaproteobacteria bacterium]MCW9049515.1 hypothetical protein [Deltaproteobacteria bacterium]
MQKQTFSAGDAIEARCTKCKQNNKHMIISTLEDLPVKVQCDICDRQHKYRPPTQPKKTVKRQAVPHKNADQKRWEQISGSADSSSAKTYSMTAAYKIDAFINHPAFGFGVVQRNRGAQKVEVLFDGGVKIMRCK